MDIPPKQSAPPATTDWSRIAASEKFRDLLALKKTFIIPAFIFFLFFYMGLYVLVGYAPRSAATRALGTVNVAYLYALGQFIFGWLIAALYLLASGRFDALTKDILARLDDPRGDH